MVAKLEGCFATTNEKLKGVKGGIPHYHLHELQIFMKFLLQTACDFKRIQVLTVLDL